VPKRTGGEKPPNDGDVLSAFGDYLPGLIQQFQRVKPRAEHPRPHHQGQLAVGLGEPSPGPAVNYRSHEDTAVPGKPVRGVGRNLRALRLQSKNTRSPELSATLRAYVSQV
jgi:hypothetical protein